MKNFNNTVGLIPAAGFARRISPLPCSKEIYPVNFVFDDKQEIIQPKVISSYLLDSLRIGGVNQIFMIIRDGKWDIPKFLSQEYTSEIDLAYLVTTPTASVPHTIDRAYNFIKGRKVLFGFPDIYFKPANAFKKLLNRQQETKADIVLGLFKTDNPSDMDMVQINKNNLVKKIRIKPDDTELSYTWIIAVWKPTFTDFLHESLILSDKKKDSAREGKNNNAKNELSMGNIIQDAINSGLVTQSVTFAEGTCLDIGTYKNFKQISNLDLEGGEYFVT